MRGTQASLMPSSQNLIAVLKSSDVLGKARRQTGIRPKPTYQFLNFIQASIFDSSIWTPRKTMKLELKMRAFPTHFIYQDYLLEIVPILKGQKVTCSFYFFRIDGRVESKGKWSKALKVIICDLIFILPADLIQVPKIEECCE